jgi:hypothetical protein
MRTSLVIPRCIPHATACSTSTGSGSSFAACSAASRNPALRSTSTTFCLLFCTTANPSLSGERSAWHVQIYGSYGSLVVHSARPPRSASGRPRQAESEALGPRIRAAASIAWRTSPGTDRSPAAHPMHQSIEARVRFGRQRLSHMKKHVPLWVPPATAAGSPGAGCVARPVTDAVRIGARLAPVLRPLPDLLGQSDDHSLLHRTAKMCPSLPRSRAGIGSGCVPGPEDLFSLTRPTTTTTSTSSRADSGDAYDRRLVRTGEFRESAKIQPSRFLASRRYITLADPQLRVISRGWDRGG